MKTGTPDQALELLRHSARVSPILRDAVDVVTEEVRRLRHELDETSLRYIEASNPGIDIEEVRREREGRRGY